MSGTFASTIKPNKLRIKFADLEASFMVRLQVTFKKPILQLGIFESLFISCEFNIPGVIVFYVSVAVEKNHYPVDSAVQPSYKSCVGI